ncbi:MAG: amino acid permease [Acidaminobacteraceae bacterium]
MDRKIGPVLLSGLMIGPILGSGVVLLPPMAYGQIGGGSIWAWILMMTLGALFAAVFVKLTILHPGDGGMTNSIEVALGKKAKLYASLLMISAVSFGPTAVMLTAADYLVKIDVLSSISKPIIAVILVLLSFTTLMRDAKFVSKVSFVISSLTATILLISSAIILMQNGINISPLSSLEIGTFGETVLLLFWAIIGWEIIGNYSSQVDRIERTIPIAAGISIVVITSTYLIISLAIQSFPYSEGLSLIEIISPVFGNSSKWILAVLVTGLCFSTYLLIVGGLARLVNTLATQKYLPKVLEKTNEFEVPTSGVIYFISVHTIVLILTQFEVLNLERIVNIANSFFLLNAIIGLIAGFIVIKSKLFKLTTIILIVCLSIIMLFSSFEILIALFVVFVISLLIGKRRESYLSSMETS